ncbi:unnamed protein product [Phytophthora fragariaefolia]|uniref:Unnamed protein product n=1 Tax=Phytophthora fragariaefolia TaxID=1490495 RepID=A0A9W7D1C2_9STRA|nr:unnamed protein product [Phytophthora fragariaefolia]
MASLASTQSVLRIPPRAVQRISWLVSGGQTRTRRRRQRRAEDALAVAKGILTTEVREQQRERAKALQTVAITEVRELTSDLPLRQQVRVVQGVVAVVRSTERERPRLGPAVSPAISATSKKIAKPPETILDHRTQRLPSGKSRLHRYPKLPLPSLHLFTSSFWGPNSEGCLRRIRLRFEPHRSEL